MRKERIIIDMRNPLATKVEKLEKLNDELVAVLDDVRDWLDTSSLQEVIVHSGKPETDALIMGIASHLTRIEAALDKVKKMNKESEK